MAKRKKYTQEFRDSAVKLITEQGYQITEAARNLGINATMLGRWKRELEGGVGGSPDPVASIGVWGEEGRRVGDAGKIRECPSFQQLPSFPRNFARIDFSCRLD